MTAPAPRTAEVYAVSVPAGVFTGDFYHFADGRDGVWFALGDVTGHGLDSAIFMAMIQELIEERWAGHCPAQRWTCCPSDAVAWIHEALAPELPVHRFVSLVLGHLSTEGTLRLTNAGHCPPLLLRRDGSIFQVPSHGPILHHLVPPGWADSCFRLSPGEKIVLYTDGVSETLSPAGEELGIAGVVGSLAGVGGCDVRSVAHGLMSDAERFGAGAPFRDDVTVMVIARRGGDRPAAHPWCRASTGSTRRMGGHPVHRRNPVERRVAVRPPSFDRLGGWREATTSS